MTQDYANYEFRRVDAESRAKYIDLCIYCFGGKPADYENYIVEEQEFACSLAAFDGDRMASAMRYFPFDMRVRDRFVGMGGVAAVTTWPEYRNRGLVRELLTRLQVMMREENRPLSVLMPFKHSYYYAMGWAPTFDMVRAEFEPAKLKRFADEGYVVRKLLDTDEWETLETLHARHGERLNGPVCRSRLHWERRYFRRGSNSRDVYLVEKDGEARGFLVCHLTDPEGDGSFNRDCMVLQAVWLDPGAERAIYNFFRSHRDQIKQVKMYLPPDVRVAHHFENPAIEQRLQAKMMTKLVDVPAALQAIGYDRSIDGGLWLQVRGEQTAPWNDGLWRLEFADGALAVQRAEVADAAVEISVQHLAQLYMGYRTVDALQQSLDIAGPPEQLEILAAAFPYRPTYMDDWF